MLPRHFLSWKTLFYGALLPALRRLGPARGDALLGGIGALAHAAWPPRRRLVEEAASRAGVVGLDAAKVREELPGHVARSLARDYLLDGPDDGEALARFEVHGEEHLASALASGRGAVVVGCHLGAYVAGLHWLYRRGIPLRLLVQRPRHVSGYLRRQFDREDGPHPQPGLFLRRGLAPADAADRLLRARAALRDGLAVYLSGDIPWCSANARPGHLLGRTRPFLAIWADLAAIARAPVVPAFCTHRPGGRYALRFERPWSVSPGGEADAVARYMALLDAAIAAQPADAVPHLTWPCYTTPGTPEATSSCRETPPRGLGREAARPARTKTKLDRP